jgi:hypothetical protein
VICGFFFMLAIAICVEDDSNWGKLEDEIET